MTKINPDLFTEARLWREGFLRIGGVDEAGRGALAGPVAAAVVILPPDRAMTRTLAGVRDSKQMTPLQRERWAIEIKKTVLNWAVGLATPVEIDELGISAATHLAAYRAVKQLPILPDYLLFDYRIELPEIPIHQASIIRGDVHSLTIACASVLAKTSRDTLVCQLDLKYPGYGLSKHKGYGTEQHRAAIQQLGYSPIHRKTFHVKN